MTACTARTRRAPGTATFAVLGILYWTAHSMLRPLIGTHVIELGGTETEVSIALASYSIFPTILAVLIGAITDRWGSRRLLRVGGALMIVGSALLFIPTLAAVIASQVVLGFGTLACWVSLQTFATMPRDDVEDRESRTKRIATFSLFVAFGQSVGPALGGGLQTLGGHTLAFAAYVALATALTIVALTLAPPASVTKTGTAAPLLGAYREAVRMLRNRTVLVAVLASFTALVIHDIRTAWQPVLLSGAGLEQWQIGIVLSTGALAGFAARPFFAVLLRRLGQALMVGLVLVTAATSVTLVVIAPGNMAFLLVISACSGFAVGFAQPLTLSMLSDEVPVERLGIASGLRSMGNQAALLASPATFGAVSAVASLGTAFLAVGGVAAAVGLTSGLLLAFPRRRPAVYDEPPASPRPQEKASTP